MITTIAFQLDFDDLSLQSLEESWCHHFNMQNVHFQGIYFQRLGCSRESQKRYVETRRLMPGNKLVALVFYTSKITQ